MNSKNDELPAAKASPKNRLNSIQMQNDVHILKKPKRNNNSELFNSKSAFESHSSYMAMKNRKLQQQHEDFLSKRRMLEVDDSDGYEINRDVEDFESDDEVERFSSDIQQELQKRKEQKQQLQRQKKTRLKYFDFLKDTRIWIDGFTNPTRAELIDMVFEAQGRLETYFSTKRVTHIIVQNVPFAKIKLYRGLVGMDGVKKRGKNIIHVVKPEWLTRSTEQKKRLPETLFIPKILRDPSQSLLANDQFKHRKILISSPSFGSKEVGETMDSYEDLENRKNQDFFKQINLYDAMLLDAEIEKVFAPKKVRFEEDVGPSGEIGSVQQQPNQQQFLQGSGDDLLGLDDQNALKASIKRLLSTSDNPNFVRDYFDQSRLHFIGSFRARYESMVLKIATLHNKQAKDLILLPAKTKHTLSSSKVIAHIDMDCFFVSVALISHPELEGKPVVVCHSRTHDKSTNFDSFKKHLLNSHGEISSANYEARKYGVKNGMFLGNAISLCPNLITVPYDFASYERISTIIYSIFFEFAKIVEGVSVDEAYLDLTEVVLSDFKLDPDIMETSSNLTDPEKLIMVIRRKIFAETKCPVSAGIGPNKLLARLATKCAKPNGQFRILEENSHTFMDSLKIRDLPGVGYKTEQKLQELNIESCKQLKMLPRAKLQQIFGDKTGTTLYNSCRGMDERKVEPLKPRKSIGAEINWGVRFNNEDKVTIKRFIVDVTNEAVNRLIESNAVAAKITVKVMIRHEDAHMLAKFLGHGKVNVKSRSAKLPSLTKSSTADEIRKVIQELTKHLYFSMDVQNEDLRGFGIHLQDLKFKAFGYSEIYEEAPQHPKILSFFGPSASKRIDASTETELQKIMNNSESVIGPEKPGPSSCKGINVLIETEPKKGINFLESVTGQSSKTFDMERETERNEIVPKSVTAPERSEVFGNSFGDLLLPSFEFIDWNVVGELPAELRQTIHENFLRDRNMSRYVESVENLRVVDTRSFEAPHRETSDIASLFDNQNNIDLSWMSKLRKYLLEHKREVCPETANVIYSKLAPLIINKKNAKLYSMLKAFSWTAIQAGGGWPETFNEVMRTVNFVMQETSSGGCFFFNEI